jgi:hypothetical protein
MELNPDSAKEIIEKRDEDLRILSVKSKISGKFAASLVLAKNGKVLLDTQPIFDSAEKAEGMIKEVIQMVRKTHTKVLKGNR